MKYCLDCHKLITEEIKCVVKRTKRNNTVKRICKNCDNLKRKAKYNTDQKFRESSIKNTTKYHTGLRRLILDVYGKKCVCCGEGHEEFLQLDHINKDGSSHRKRVGINGVYRDVRNMGFPKNKFRILCSNCNQSLGMRGYCPHQI